MARVLLGLINNVEADRFQGDKQFFFQSGFGGHGLASQSSDNPMRISNEVLKPLNAEMQRQLP